MKKSFLLLLSSLAGMMLLFTSCKKELTNPNDEEIISTPLPSPTTYCRVESVWTNPGGMDQQFFLISYDDYENPKFITTPLPATGQPFRVFKYDGWHRLKEYLGMYGNGNFEEWHFYGFDKNGRIGYDTVYLLGTLGEKPTNYWKRVDQWITYDNWGRISRVVGVDNMGGTSDVSYNYDASGNLMRPGFTYDHQVNASRTNDIWMFLLRDYSMNNPGTATSYNASGYPTAFNLPTPLNWVTGPINWGPIGDACRQSFYH